MTRHPIPPHGTPARYKGTRHGRPPCRCTACTRANRISGIRRQQARAAGETLLISRDTILPHLETLRDSGMSQTLIARHANISQATISYLLNGKIQSCRRAKALAILAVRPGQFDELAERPALGASRRVRALYAIGHGRNTISDATGLSACTIGQIANSRYTLVDGRVDAAIRLAYRQLVTTPGRSKKAAARAASQKWAPPGAWDDIDDPDAAPDWTGHCGTDRGYWIHQRQQLPTCARCQAAHEQWLADNAALGAKGLNHACFRARATAVTREADLAADARELLSYGVPVDQAAERLGVSRNHLQQAMLRHPANATELAA